MALSAAAPADCELLKTFLTRFGVLFLGALGYVIYTGVRMRNGYDKRNFAEFAAMFFNLGAHQAVGGAVGETGEQQHLLAAEARKPVVVHQHAVLMQRERADE